MKKKRYTEEQIAFALRQSEAGTPVAEVIRKMGTSEQTSPRPTSDAPRSHRWKKHYAGLGVSELRRLKQLEEENKKLKALVADLSLDKRMLQDALSGK
jgi:putative transposase